jgi:hypothetical protein
MVRKYQTLRSALLVVVLVAPTLRADIVVRARDRDMRSAPDPIVQELLDKFVVAQIAGDGCLNWNGIGAVLVLYAYTENCDGSCGRPAAKMW